VTSRETINTTTNQNCREDNPRGWLNVILLRTALTVSGGIITHRHKFCHSELCMTPQLYRPRSLVSSCDFFILTSELSKKVDLRRHTDLFS